MKYKRIKHENGIKEWQIFLVRKAYVSIVHLSVNLFSSALYLSARDCNIKCNLTKCISKKIV